MSEYGNLESDASRAFVRFERELSAAIEGDQQLSPAERNALQKLLQSNRDEAAMTATVVD